MSNKEELINEIVELLLIWSRINGMHGALCWPGAYQALEERINKLCEEAGLVQG